jgi:hypothetical protein
LIHIYTINIEFLTNDIDSLIIFSLTFMRESTPHCNFHLVGKLLNSQSLANSGQ